ncbi:MAG: hypothetical protein RLO12_14295 [Fulvivirga sp.]
MKRLIQPLIVFLLLNSCTDKRNNSSNEVISETISVAKTDARFIKTSTIQDDLLTSFKGRWILTDYFKKIEQKREFWIEENYPSSSFAEIEIKESTIVAKGWHEDAELEIVKLSATKYKTTYPPQYWIIELDTAANRISAELFEDNKSEWKYYYTKLKPNSTFDITKLEMMIKANCLEGTYNRIDDNKKVEISNNQIDSFTYWVITDYEHICDYFNLLEIEMDSIITASWEWQSDTLKIYQLERTFEEEGCITLKKTKKIKELKLRTMAKES